MPRPSDPSKALLWQKHLADFSNSQLTVPQFCQSIGCSVPTFYHWKRKLQEPTQPSAFLRVQTTDPQPACIEVRLPSGITLRVPLSVSVQSLGSSRVQVAGLRRVGTPRATSSTDYALGASRRSDALRPPCPDAPARGTSGSIPDGSRVKKKKSKKGTHEYFGGDP